MTSFLFLLSTVYLQSERLNFFHCCLTKQKSIFMSKVTSNEDDLPPVSFFVFFSQLFTINFFMPRLFQSVTQLYDLSPLYWDLCISHLFPTFREHRNIVQLCTRVLPEMAMIDRFPALHFLISLSCP